MSNKPAAKFADLDLSPAVLQALDAVGYETPTPIQAATIPPLLEGRDVLGQAQTGTGKTAAFALPMISRLQRRGNVPSALVLTPTRELAIQVSEAIGQYASKTGEFRVLPVYGGADYRPQLRALQRGVDVVVGTPGRVMDHIRRKSLNVSQLQVLVLDEADEMLRMGFIDDVEWVLEQTPAERQVALFSATMPRQVQTIAERHLKNPVHVRMESKVTTAETINQRYLIINGRDKGEAFTRLLETMEFDGMIVFVRTKNATTEVADMLAARGYSAASMSGDLSQDQREATVARLKSGKLDIVVATDVAARGLDVERISHVINYDIPNDAEAYVHRIGRTGRAGRSGEAILFVQPREQRMLKVIERVGGRPIERMDLPTVSDVNASRVTRIKEQILGAAKHDAAAARELIAELQQESGLEVMDVAVALLQQLHGDDWLLDSRAELRIGKKGGKDFNDRSGGKQDRFRKNDRGNDRGQDRRPSRKPKSDMGPVAAGWARYSVAVGHEHQLKPGNLVGAIANEIGIDAKTIGRIDIHDSHSIVDLPNDLSGDALNHLKTVWVCQQQLRIRPAFGESENDGGGSKPFRGKPGGKPGGKPKSKGKGKPYAKKPKWVDGKPPSKPA